jgi:hypothetical protein
MCVYVCMYMCMYVLICGLLLAAYRIRRVDRRGKEGHPLLSTTPTENCTSCSIKTIFSSQSAVYPQLSPSYAALSFILSSIGIQCFDHREWGVLSAELMNPVSFPNHLVLLVEAFIPRYQHFIIIMHKPYILNGLQPSTMHIDDGWTGFG